MVLLNDGDRKTLVSLARTGQPPGLGRTRLARELFSGRDGGDNPYNLAKLRWNMGWTTTRS
jgi:hypothetical protein